MKILTNQSIIDRACDYFYDNYNYHDCLPYPEDYIDSLELWLRKQGATIDEQNLDFRGDWENLIFKNNQDYFLFLMRYS